MIANKMIIMAASAAALALPAAASAQQYYGQSPEGRQYSQQPYGQQYQQPRGDWNQGRRGFSGYPEYRGIEAHIRQEIAEAVRDDMIERGDARDLMNQLRQIQAQEAREFRVHRWNLPDDDRMRIRSQLTQLDQVVDQTRNEQ